MLIVSSTVIGDGHVPDARRISTEYGNRMAISFYETEKTPGAWGGPQRTKGMHEAQGTHVLFIDDDDAYAPNAFDAVRRSASENPSAFQIFKMQSCSDRRPWKTLWGHKSVFLGNIGTPMVCIPNIKDRFGTWGTYHAGDFEFIDSTIKKWPGGEAGIVWKEDVIVHVF
jgi:hypothetical protein